MVCPNCGSYGCARSHRRVAERILSALKIYPWRCLDCKHRFYAGNVSLRYLHYAHCPRCGNLELMRVQRRHLAEERRVSLGTRLAARLGARSLRCDLCRLNFASWRPLLAVRERHETPGIGEHSFPSGH